VKYDKANPPGKQKDPEHQKFSAWLKIRFPRPLEPPTTVGETASPSPKTRSNGFETVPASCEAAKGRRKPGRVVVSLRARSDLVDMWQ
jgi:hypothetical protein